MNFEVWDHKDEALVLLPLPDGTVVDTSGEDWTLQSSFEASSETDAQIKFEVFVGLLRRYSGDVRLAKEALASTWG